MHVHVHSYAIYLIISTLISILALVIAWRRSGPGSSALKLLLLAMAVWSGAYAVSWFEIPPEVRSFWLGAMYVGAVFVPVLFLFFVLGFTRREKWLTRPRLLLFSIVPFVSLLLQWTNGYHRLIYVSIDAAVVNNYLIVHYERGPWYYGSTFYSYTVIALGFFLLAVSAIRSGPILRGQYRQILAASAIPWLASLYSELSYPNHYVFDLAPLSFGLTGFLFVYSAFRNRFLEVIPVARNRLIENMSDGVLVVDPQGQVLDINPAMMRLLNIEHHSQAGRHVSEILNGWLDQDPDLWLHGKSRTELRLSGQPSRYLDLRMTPLYDQRESLVGRILVFRDITDRKMVEKDLLHANEKLQTQLVEIGLLQGQLREQAIRDPLTNLFNRRYLEETLERELSRAEREAYPLCIIMMDVDHFKYVNDTYGHEAGDNVLQAVADLVTARSRHGDFTCRYGGEEFVLVMPNINIETATGRALELNQSIEGLNIAYGLFNLSVTVSMGIAWYPEHGRTREELLRAADQALYLAKHAGRNRVIFYREVERTLE